MKTTIIPRGIRNNNPLNIRIGNTWLGERNNPTDTQFEEFVNIKYGLRAAFCILRRYIRLYRRQTITDIISTWAPASENNTRKYIDVVAARVGIAANALVKFEDKETMCRLVQAMAFVECGRELDVRDIESGYDMA